MLRKYKIMYIRKIRSYISELRQMESYLKKRRETIANFFFLDVVHNRKCNHIMQELYNFLLSFYFFIIIYKLFIRIYGNVSKAKPNYN